MSYIADFRRLVPAVLWRWRSGKPAVMAALLAGVLTATALPAAAQIQIPQPQGQPPAPQGQQPAPVTPQAQPDPGTPFGAWTQRCTPSPPPGSSPPKAGKQEACFLVQQVADPNTQRPVMKVTIGYFEPGRQPAAVIVMPLGVPLARGGQVSVDGKTLGTVPFEVCRRDGCQSFMPMSTEIVSAFKAGSQATVIAQSSQGAALNLPLSLRGFTAGFASLD
jgi:invasion protein IalB